MRSASANLLAMLNGADNALVMADCYTITLLGGQVLRYTDFDVDLSIGGNVYASGGIKIVRSRVKWVAGLEVDVLDLTIFAGPNDLLNGLPFLQQVTAGVLDGATIRLDRAYMYPGNYSAESLQLFSGRVATVHTGRTEARVSVKSHLELLNIKLPRNVYQAGCGNTLFDSMCGLTKSAYKVTGSVAGVANYNWFGSSLTQAAGFFDLGTVTFTSGANSGISRAVRAYANGAFAVSLPWPNIPSSGDSFEAYPGCDKLLTTCTAKFNNKANFRGQPFIPIPETAY